jgi:thiamine-phosphate pyrophosphorylase
VLPRLYAILDIDLCAGRGLDPDAVLDGWLAAGVRLVQLRAKALSSSALLTLSQTCRDRCRRASAMFIVNDRADVARMAGADGVHVGQDDLDPRLVRQLVPAPGIVGLSTHSDAEVAAAMTVSIDYLAIGPVFATGSKANPDPVVGLGGVRRAVAIAGHVPVVAIGGITIERAGDVFGAGAASVAVISDLLVGDVRVRARRWLDAVDAIH